MWLTLLGGAMIGIAIASGCIVAAIIADYVVALFEDLCDIYDRYFKI